MRDYPNLPVVVMSAHIRGASPAQNDIRTRLLKEDLTQAGLTFAPAKEYFEGIHEAGFIVPLPWAKDFQTVLEYARVWTQDSVLYLAPRELGARKAWLYHLDGTTPIEAVGLLRPVDSPRGHSAWTLNEATGRFYVAS